jgi:hypothetical protein
MSGVTPQYQPRGAQIAGADSHNIACREEISHSGSQVNTLVFYRLRARCKLADGKVEIAINRSSFGGPWKAAMRNIRK